MPAAPCIQAVPGGSKSAGFVAVGISDTDVTAVAYLTAATKYVPSKLNVCVRAGAGAFGAPAPVDGRVKPGQARP